MTNRCNRCGKTVQAPGQELCDACCQMMKARIEAETGIEVDCMSSGYKDKVYEQAENMLVSAPIVDIRSYLSGKRDGKYERVVDPSIDCELLVGMILVVPEGGNLAQEGLIPGEYLIYDHDDIDEDGLGDAKLMEIKGIDFSDALTLLKYGHQVRREGWNGKGMWLMLIGPTSYEIDEMETANLRPWIGISIVDGSFGPWTPSQADILADDWELVE